MPTCEDRVIVISARDEDPELEENNAQVSARLFRLQLVDSLHSWNTVLPLAMLKPPACILSCLMDGNQGQLDCSSEAHSGQ